MKQLGLMLCLMLAWGGVQAQAVYKVIQPDGTVEYTDAPPPGESAEPIKVEPLNSADPVAPQGAVSSMEAGGEAQGYSQFRITSPGNGEAIRDNAGNVNIDLTLEPPLRSGDKIDLQVDGRSVGGGNRTAITLSNLDRGAHSVQAVVKNRDGKVVARSNSVSFTLQRRSAILQPAPSPHRVRPFGGGRAS